MPKMPVATPQRSAPKSNFLEPLAFQHLLGDLRHGKIGSLPISLLYFQMLHLDQRKCDQNDKTHSSRNAPRDNSQ